MEIRFDLNGKRVRVEVPSHWTLLRLLREKLGLTGTKEGCGIGECGTCTVLVDGMPVNSCLVMAPKVEGRKVETVEGLGTRDSLHPLQQSFIDHGAVQCGFCTPGILMSSKALLNRNPSPSQEEIREAISGHLCRCTGYHQIVEAVERASRQNAKCQRSNDKLKGKGQKSKGKMQNLKGKRLTDISSKGLF